MPTERRLLADWVREEYDFGIRRACRVMQISRTVYQYQAKRCSDQEIIDALTLLAENYPRYRFMKLRGYPTKIRSDNGPEFIAEKTKKWAEKKGIKWEFIKPGKPTQNAFIERFNRTYREEVLDFYTFNRLSEVREKTKLWLVEYNEERPHEALGHLTPIEYLTTK